MSLVIQEFDAHGTIVEKCDVQRRTSDIASGIRFGYSSNEVGFRWTNAAVLDLLVGLSAGKKTGDQESSPDPLHDERALLRR